jgi:hypothetical protein
MSSSPECRKVQEAMDRSGGQPASLRNSEPANRTPVQDWTTLRAVHAKSLPSYNSDRGLRSDILRSYDAESPRRKLHSFSSSSHHACHVDGDHFSGGIGCQIEMMRYLSLVGSSRRDALQACAA